MLKARITTLICLCFWATGSTAQTNFPSAYEGLWAGDGVQVNGRNWTIELVLERDQSFVLYPTFQCGGHWEYVEQGLQHLTAIETLGLGMDRCTDGLQIRLCARDETTIIGLWFFSGTEPFAAAVLHPSPSQGERDETPVQLSIEALAAECSPSAGWLGS